MIFKSGVVDLEHSKTVKQNQHAQHRVNVFLPIIMFSVGIHKHYFKPAKIYII